MHLKSRKSSLKKLSIEIFAAIVLMQITASTIVVGILSLQSNSLSGLLKKNFQEYDMDEIVNSTSFIAETYIDWVKSADMHPVIFDITLPIEKLVAKLSEVDAMLLTGGRQSFFNQRSNETDIKIPTPYLSIIGQIVSAVIEENNRGHRMPIWSTCLGFEAMLVHLTNYNLIRRVVDNEIKSADKVTLVNYQTKSLRFFSPEDHEYMQKARSFYFNHKFGIFAKDFYFNKYLRDNVDIVAVKEFGQEPIVVWFEFRNYPFFGTQFHPEKFPFDQQLIQGNGDRLKREEINHKMARLLKSMAVDRGRQIVPDVEQNVETLRLLNIGVYPAIEIFVRK